MRDPIAAVNALVQRAQKIDHENIPRGSSWSRVPDAQVIRFVAAIVTADEALISAARVEVEAELSRRKAGIRL